MPRMPKWVKGKAWLSYADVSKVLLAAPSEIETVFSKDESEELKKKYKFVCTFMPMKCQAEFKEYRLEVTARSGMREHIKGHINDLQKWKPEFQEEFVTKNNLYQPVKGQKHKIASSSSDNETPAKKSKGSTSTKATSAKPSSPKSTAKSATAKSASAKSASSKSTSAKSATTKCKLEPVSQKQFTLLKWKKRNRTNSKGSTDNESLRSSSDAENENSVHSSLQDLETKMFGSPLHGLNLKDEDLNIGAIKGEVLSSDEERDELDYDDNDDEDDDDDDPDNKEAGCQTQTDANGKGVQTLQYKMSTKLFASDRSQWGNIEQALEDMLAKEDEKLSEEIKGRVILSMQMWIESSKIFDHLVKLKLQDPLTHQEQETLNSMTPEDWQRLDKAKDDESKLRLMAYARLLLRDYEWYPRKLKPKKCQHCQKEYTASTSLNSHLMSLSGIRFWVCARCKRADKDEATFTRKHSLQYHILKEAGIPRYRCSEPGCSKTHNHTHHQKSHARQHTGEKHYICKYDDCDGQFSNRNTYSRHLLQYHNAELTKHNAIKEIDEKEAQLRVYANRLKARERSKTKRQRTDGDTPSIEQRALTHLMQNQDSPNTPEIEDLLKPSASQALYRVARDIRKERADSGILGGLNLLATVSNYMNVEECKGNSEKAAENGTNNNKSPSYTKLIEALDIDQSPRKVPSSTLLCEEERDFTDCGSNQNSLTLPKGLTVSKPAIETAVVVPKPTVLLPLPAGRMNTPKAGLPSQAQRLPNTIQNLKARLMADSVIPKHNVARVIKPPIIHQIHSPAAAQIIHQSRSPAGHIIHQPQSPAAAQIIHQPQSSAAAQIIHQSHSPAAAQIIRPAAQPSTMQVLRPMGDTSQMGTSKIIINLAQQVPVASSSSSLVVLKKPQATTSAMSSLLSQQNVSATRMSSTSTASAPTLTVLNSRPATAGAQMPNSLFGTSYLVVAAPPNIQSQMPPASLIHNNNSNMMECKTIPFSQL